MYWYVSAPPYGFAFGHANNAAVVTLYSDQYCSNDATETKLNQCAGVGGPTILSLSVDGCDVPFFAADNSSATSTQSLFSTDSATSVQSSSSSTSTIAADTSSANSGLTTGAKAGVGVGVAIGALLFIAGAVMLWFARRRTRAKGVNEHQELDGTREISEKMTAPDNAQPSQELPSPAAELETSKDRQELPAEYAYVKEKRRSHGPQELPGSSP